MPTNQQIHLDNRPVGEAVASNFKLVTTETPALQDGQVLVRNIYVSVDPTNRVWMNDAPSYLPRLELGEVMLLDVDRSEFSRSIGSALSSTVSGVQPSLRWALRTGRGWLNR